MLSIRLSPSAENDIKGILSWKDKQFGESIRLRYEALLVQAMLDLSIDSQRGGVELRPEIGKKICSYHLHFSQDHVDKSIGRIRKPRHFVLFRQKSDGVLEVVRVLLDSMELSNRLPPGYQADDSDA